MNFLDQYQLRNQTLLPQHQQQHQLSHTTQQQPHHNLLDTTNSTNLLLSNLLFPSSSSPSTLMNHNHDFTSKLSMVSAAAAAASVQQQQQQPQQQQQQQQPQSSASANISNQLICSQLEMLQQFQLSKQQEQQKEQYKIALLQELLKLEQQQPTRPAVQQPSQLFDSMNPFLLGAPQFGQTTPSSSVLNAVPSLIHSQQLQTVTPQSTFGFDVLQQLAKQDQLCSIQTQQQQQQLLFNQPIGSLHIDSQISLSQATSKANSPFGNVRSFGEEDQTMMQGAQQLYQKLEEIQVESTKAASIRFPREFACGEDEAERLRSERLVKIEKFRNKRRNWLKKISYDCRKKVADSRLRVKGRFISKKDTQKIKELVGTSTQQAFNEKRNLRLEFMTSQMREQNIEIQHAVSKNEILGQIEKLLTKNKEIHTQHTIECVLNRIRNKQPVFECIRRNTIPLAIIEKDEHSIESESDNTTPMMEELTS